MPNKIQLRRGTAAQWATANPVLSAGEPGVEVDTLRQKIGNGTTAWVDLPYQVVEGQDMQFPSTRTLNSGAGVERPGVLGFQNNDPAGDGTTRIYVVPESGNPPAGY